MSLYPRYQKPKILRELNPTQHTLIEASAGTGKTYTIEHLVVHLLIEYKVPISKILIVTFTDKAAGEIKGRLRQLLIKLQQLAPHHTDNAPADVDDADCWILDEAVRRRIDIAIREFDGATISTIHAFCQRVLSENPFESKRMFSESRASGEQIFHESFSECLRTLFTVDDTYKPVLQAYLFGGKKRTDDLESLLWQCYLSHGKIGPDFDIARIYEAFSAFPTGCADAIKAFFSENCQKGRPLKDICEDMGFSRAAGSVETRYKHVEQAVLQAMSKFGNDIDGTTITTSQAIDAIYAWEESAGRTKAGSDAAKKRHDRTYFDGLRHLVAAAQRLLQGRPFTLFDDLLESLLELDEAIPSVEAAVATLFLPPIIEKVQRKKQEQGVFDFDDMLTLVQRSLDGEDGATMIRILRERYQYALIDEFQDTDEIQWDIFRRIFFDSTVDSSVGNSNHLGMIEGKGSNYLSLIGDPKQAIYSFRGADVDTYLRARRALKEAGSTPLNLVENFRSSASLIEAYNRILDQKVPPDRYGIDLPFFSHPDIRYDQPVKCGNQKLRLDDGSGAAYVDGLQPIHIFTVIEQNESQKHLMGVLGARIAHEIKSIALPRDRPIHSPEHVDENPLYIHAEQGRTPLRYRDIFILTRSKSELALIAEQLRIAGIPHAFYKQEGLLQTEEAKYIYRLLAAISDPDDKALCMQAWATPFYHVDLHELRHCSEVSAHHHFLASLLDWKIDADARRYERLFSRILSKSGILRRLILCEEDERMLTNIEHIFEILLDEVAASRPSISELVQLVDDFIHERRAPTQPDSTIQRVAGDRDAVQLMTLHTSKGLEAPVVFLAGGVHSSNKRGSVNVYHDEVDGQSVRRIYVGSKPPPHIADRIDQEARWEDERLWYVGITRAKLRLYLPFFPPDSASQKVRVDGSFSPVNERLTKLLDHEGTRLLHVPDNQLFCISFASKAKVIRHQASLDPARLAAWEPAPELLADPAHINPEEAYDALRGKHSGYIITSYTQLSAQQGKFGSILQRGLLGGALRDENAADFAQEASVLLGAGRLERLPPNELPSSATSGVFMHELLEKISVRTILSNESRELDGKPSFARWKGREDVQRMLTNIADRHGIALAYRDHALEMAFYAMARPLPPAIGVASAKRLLREVEFLYPIPEKTHPLLSKLSQNRHVLDDNLRDLEDLEDLEDADRFAEDMPDEDQDQQDQQEFTIQRGYIKGFIDVIFEDLHGLVFLADWKSDRLPSYDRATVLAHVNQHYRLQAKLYCLAVIRMLNIKSADEYYQRFGGMFYIFLRAPVEDIALNDDWLDFYGRLEFDETQYFDSEWDDLPIPVDIASVPWSGREEFERDDVDPDELHAEQAAYYAHDADTENDEYDHSRDYYFDGYTALSVAEEILDGGFDDILEEVVDIDGEIIHHRPITRKKQAQRGARDTQDTHDTRDMRASTNNTAADQNPTANTDKNNHTNNTSPLLTSRERILTVNSGAFFERPSWEEIITWEQELLKHGDFR